jgi:tRNA dimethylallyltransferase
MRADGLAMSVATRDMADFAGEALKGAVLIAGPTASGKSALALRLARESGGAIVNADSMQVYSILNVLTARPPAEELKAAPHLLYGHVHPSQAYSTGAWLRDVAGLAEGGAFATRRPIFTGGTGLYFRALLEGLSRMPDVPAEVRNRWRERLADEGASELHRLLARDDPEAAQRIRPSDGQRIVRALEVLEASGRPITAWQGDRGRPLVDRASAAMFVVEPDREELAARIRIRLEGMVERGALEEVRELLALDISPAMPAMKAIGVPEFGAVIERRSTVEEAVERAAVATRQYAKRQSTWFRNQLGPEWRRIGHPNEVGAGESRLAPPATEG